MKAADVERSRADPAAVAAVGMCEGQLTGAWQAAPPHRFPLAAPGRPCRPPVLLARAHAGLSRLWFSRAFCKAF